MTKHKKNIGQFGENLAKEYLIRKGFKIIDSNKKIGNPEIDIITKKNNETIFVEVKTRTSKIFGEADETLRTKQIKTLKKAISIYCFRNKINMNFIRLDLIAIDINKLKKTANIKHYKNIF